MIKIFILVLFTLTSTFPTQTSDRRRGHQSPHSSDSREMHGSLPREAAIPGADAQKGQVCGNQSCVKNSTRLQTATHCHHGVRVNRFSKQPNGTSAWLKEFLGWLINHWDFLAPTRESITIVFTRTFMQGLPSTRVCIPHIILTNIGKAILQPFGTRRAKAP